MIAAKKFSNKSAIWKAEKDKQRKKNQNIYSAFVFHVFFGFWCLSIFFAHFECFSAFVFFSITDDEFLQI
jgi:hypothetical protein